jgi:ABC-2 type transport system permease protein
VNPRHVVADFKVFSRGYLRNSAALFFSLIFPIILIGIFGLIYSGGTSTVTLYTENLDHASPTSVAFLEALNKTGAVTVQLVSPSVGGGNLSSYLGANSDPVGLVIPAGFAADYANHTAVSLVFYGNPADASSLGIAEGTIQGVANAFNLQLANGTAVVGVHPENVGSPLFGPIDYLVPGLIGFSILTSPMFSMVEISSSYKKDHLFQQLSLTPLTKSEWLLSKVLWYVILSMISAAIMIGFGLYVFGGHFMVTAGVLPFLVLGPLFFVALGMLCGSLTRTPETAAVIGNIVTFPMMFLSGTFFPVSDFPPALQAFAHILPLYYIIDGMNQVMLFGNGARALVDLGIILICAIVVFAGAVSVFKWREA